MNDLAPDIYRQRLLVEGTYQIEMDEAAIDHFFSVLLAGLGMTAAGTAVVNSSIGKGQEKNQGIEAFLPLIESGVAVYTWNSARFLSLIIYTCKAFETEAALEIVRETFQLSQMEHKVF